MVSRPPLPLKYANPNIREHLLAPTLPPVKYQILNCQGKDILVGRLKIETPTETGHAFILRRFDTGAVSLTTMFRAAFPNASEHDEKVEIQWVKDNYDLSGNNGSSKDPNVTRLAGTWVSPELALELGKAYSLGALIQAVVDASPDPSATYRRSGKAAAAAASATSVLASTTTTPNGATAVTATSSVESSTIVVSKPPSAAKSLPTPSPTSSAPPTKRRKESTPDPPQDVKPSRASPTPSKTTVAPRRSTRTKSQSPAPRSTTGTVAPLTSLRTPKTTRSTKAPPSTSKKAAVQSDLASVDEEAVEYKVAVDELHKEDVKDQLKLIEDLKAQRDAAMAADQDSKEGLAESSKKREREEEDKPLKFEFKEPETEERAIATNRRVGRFNNLEPRTKSVAWGIAAFAFGLGAMYLPTFF